MGGIDEGRGTLLVGAPNETLKSMLLRYEAELDDYHVGVERLTTSMQRSSEGLGELFSLVSQRLLEVAELPQAEAKEELQKIATILTDVGRKFSRNADGL